MRTAGLLAFALLLATPSARADEPVASQATPQADASDGRARADELIRAGVELRRQGHEREALERFREAHALHPSPRTLGQMGLAAKSLRLYVEAEGFLDGALAASDDPWVQQNKDALEAARDMVAKQLASLMVTSNVDGAELYVNGSLVGKLPLPAPVRVDAGPVRIELRAKGHKPTDSGETLPAGQTTEVRLDLTYAPPPPAVTAPAPAEPDRTPPPRESLLPWILVAGGVGVAGITVGSYFGIQTLSLKSDLEKKCPVPNGKEDADSIDCSDPDAADIDGRARSAAAVSTVGFVVGGVGLAAGAVLLAIELRSKTPAARTPRAVGGPTAHGGYLGIAGSF